MTMTTAQTTEIYAVAAQFNNIPHSFVCREWHCDLPLEIDFAKQNKMFSSTAEQYYVLLCALSGSSNSGIVPHVADAWAPKKIRIHDYYANAMEEEEQKMSQGDASLPSVWYSFGSRNKRHSDQVGLNVDFGSTFAGKKNREFIYSNAQCRIIKYIPRMGTIRRKFVCTI